MRNKILAIVAHPDDEIIGCGGSLIKHIINGDKVQVVFTMNCEARSIIGNKLKNNSTMLRYDVAKKVSSYLKFEKPIFLNYPNLTMERKNILNLNNDLKKIIQRLKPNIIYTHFSDDIHHDHRSTYEATLISSRVQYNDFIERILMFEVPSASDSFFNKNNFNPNVFINIEEELKKKNKAIKLYKHEILKYPNSRSFKGIENLSKYRGNIVKFKYAEAFQLIREKIK